MGGGGHTLRPDPAPELEPVKSAEQAMNEAGTDAGRSQQLRRGLASTFSRTGMGGGAISKATSGSAAKLGN